MNKLAQLLQQKSLKIAVAESCTGGNLAARLTEQSGASAYFDRGFITYSNQAKIDMLGVESATLSKFGAVSEQVAQQMVFGAVSRSDADVAVSITGVAGPNGGSPKKPVGTVCFAFYNNKNYTTTTQHFKGDRDSIVKQSVDFAINTLIKQL